MMVTLVQTTVCYVSVWQMYNIFYYVHVWIPPRSGLKMKTLTCKHVGIRLWVTT